MERHVPRHRRSAFPGLQDLSERHRLLEELVTARLAVGLSQTEVAAKMGTSQSSVARLESGGADMRLSTLQRYANAVGLDVSWQLRASP